MGGASPKGEELGAERLQRQQDLAPPGYGVPKLGPACLYRTLRGSLGQKEPPLSLDPETWALMPSTHHPLLTQTDCVLLGQAPDLGPPGLVRAP